MFFLKDVLNYNLKNHPYIVCRMKIKEYFYNTLSCLDNNNGEPIKLTTQKQKWILL